MTFIRSMNISSHNSESRVAIGMAIIALLALPGMRNWLESGLITHMLVQIPLLVLGGWVIAAGLPNSRLQHWNEGGIPGLLLALFAMLFWMIPRWLDAALSESFWEVLKFISIPLLIGVPLGSSWPRMSSFARAVVWCNTISMLVVTGWLYLAAPVRVCNNYLVNQQQDFGYAAMALALFIAVYWTGLLFFGNWKQSERQTGQQPEKRCG